MERKKDKNLKFERGYLKSNHRKVHFYTFASRKKPTKAINRDALEKNGKFAEEWRIGLIRPIGLIGQRKGKV